MWPLLRSAIRGPNARQPWTTPPRLMLSTRWKSVEDVSKNRPPCPTPALLIRTSGTPCLAHTSSAKAVTAASSDTSSAYGYADPPSFSMSPTVSLAVSWLISATTTRAPWRAKASEVSRPMPLPAPVTTTRLLRWALPDVMHPPNPAHRCAYVMKEIVNHCEQAEKDVTFNTG
ncbi:Uncharacterised protein [Mycobacteroides abscessus subsp. abscessus]|nr:Uncharacterised protein [Mycobacteroides abscessus subsp. abscessus]